MGNISEDRPGCRDQICISLGWDLSAGGASDTTHVSWLGVDVGAWLFLRASVNPKHTSTVGMQHLLCQSVGANTNMVYTGLNFAVLGMLAIYYTGFHSGGRRGYVSVVVFCTREGECFPHAALAGCWLKPGPRFDTSWEIIHVWYRPEFSRVHFTVLIGSKS